jgi:hypothetical protein
MLKWKQGWGEEDLLYAIARIRAQDSDSVQRSGELLRRE